MAHPRRPTRHHNAHNDPRQQIVAIIRKSPALSTAPVRIHLARVNLLQIPRAQDPPRCPRRADDQAQIEYENKSAHEVSYMICIAFGIMPGLSLQAIFAS
jgi:hypothetical protein